MAEQKSGSFTTSHAIHLIVSGGQTGVDRAALDAAMAAGIPIGGWCPRGRRSEVGPIPDSYPLEETAARSYAVRTEWNVRDSDGTLVIVLDEISRGTRLTLDFAKRQNKPLLVVHLRADAGDSLFADKPSLTDQLAAVADWIDTHQITTLNIAGPRGSSDADVYPESRRFLDLFFNHLNKNGSGRKQKGEFT